MKKPKLTAEEKQEIKKEKKSWSWLIRMAKRKKALVDDPSESFYHDKIK